MHTIFTHLRLWIDALLAAPRAADPLDAMDIVAFADLPPTHPRGRER